MYSWLFEHGGLEKVVTLAAFGLLGAILVTGVGLIAVVRVYRKEIRGRFRKTESEKRLGRERI